jgi:cell division protein FtsW (lipid II flippase)
MRITYSTATDRARAASEARKGTRRGVEFVALACTSLISLVGFILVYNAKTAAAPDIARQLGEKTVVDLNRVQSAADLLPALGAINQGVSNPAKAGSHEGTNPAEAGSHERTNPARAGSRESERQAIAERLYTFLATTDNGARRKLESVGGLGRAGVTAGEIARDRRLAFLTDRLTPSNAAATPAKPAPADRTISLLTGAQIADLRPSMVVRSLGDFRWSFLTAVVMFFAGFWLVHVFGQVRRAWAPKLTGGTLGTGERGRPGLLGQVSQVGGRGDALLLPIVQLLCGIGLMTMTSLRDPWRDAMLLTRFAQGTMLGCVLMAAVSIIDFQRSELRKLSYVPLAAAFLLSLLLILFGTGPGASDARVNLFGMQPVEVIRVLVLLFLAGYFANRWEFLRELKEERPPHPLLRGFEVPRLEYVLPVLVGIGLVLVFFFLQKDLGPALVLSCVFLALYGVARKRLTLVVAGLLLLVAGFAAGYLLDFPHTVVQRVAMWRSPWDNAVRGGDQVSHAIWALATGAWSGSGLGLGDPRFIPAAHTDLVLAAIGEELGFAGLLAVFALFALLTWRALRIALGAPGDYTFFLALGITLSFALELLLIAGGILGLLPLTGVVTPFLSYGRSSMFANLAALGALLAISERSTKTVKIEFRTPVIAIAGITAVLAGIIVLRLGLVQVLAADHFVSAANLTVQADGGRRFEYNPRLLAVAPQIVRGTIYDRNGVPLAATKRADLEKHADELEKLGVKLDERCPRPDARCYPFGGLTFHLLGDWDRKVNWAARNTSFEERDSDRVLRGYDDHARVVNVADARTGAVTHVIRRDYRELVPLVRHRYEPDHPSVKTLLHSPRDLRMSIDIRLQVRVADDLKKRVEAAGKNAGAAVVLSDAGDLLAAVSYPWPQEGAWDPASAGFSRRSASDPASAGVGRRGASAVGGDTDIEEDETDEALLDRARYGLYPPGSSFKLVTATAALRKDPSLEHATFTCQRLPDGRVGAPIRGWGRPIRDDVQDTVPHGTLDMPRAIVVSCNAYFAQLGMRVGAQSLIDTAHLFEISLGQPESLKQVRDLLPFSAYGQGQVLASPFKMARVAATIADGGSMPYGRWVIDDSNRRADAPRSILSPPLAGLLARTMREVVTSGTGRSLIGIEPPIAGKTGTAEVQGEASHSWFVGFAPYAAPVGKRIAFAVIIEHGGYGGASAAPVAGDIVTDARQLGIIK